MPSYIVSNVKSTPAPCCCDTSMDSSPATFFSNLATKLLDMSQAIAKKMEELSNKVCKPSSGFSMVHISTPILTINVKYEYIEYIKRYGPPENGIFDDAKIARIKKDLGI